MGLHSYAEVDMLLFYETDREVLPKAETILMNMS
jgi:hypothetical protein